jgi:hypothetical protein
MTRRLGLASLVVVVLAFAGGAAGPARPLQQLRLVVSVCWLASPERVEREARADAPRVEQPAAVVAARAPRSVAFCRFLVERWLFQRPPPVAI